MSLNWRDAVIEEAKASRRIAHNDPQNETASSHDPDLGVMDPRDGFGLAPEYPMGMLPKKFEDFFQHKIAGWGGDPASYAIGFAAMHCATLDASIKMAPNPLMPDVWRCPNDFALIVGKTGQKKSGVWRDITAHLDGYQKAMIKAAATSTNRKQMPMAFLQQTTVEGMMAQLSDNKGVRLCVGSEEVMNFFNSAGAHRGDSATTSMSDTVCAVYDGGSFSKRKAQAKDTIIVAEALATIIGVTVDTNLMTWREFPAMIKSGLMARHSVGIISRLQPTDASKLNPQADKDMSEFLVLLRGLKDMRLQLTPEAKAGWQRYREQREQLNEEMEEAKENEGLIAYCRKYEMRVMSLATIFALYDFIEAGDAAVWTAVQVPATEAEADKATGGMKTLKYVDLTVEHMERAVNFFENFLLPSQEHFYKVAGGMNEFSMELINFAASHLTNDDRKNPNYRDLSRGDLVNRGPTSLRGGMTPALKEAHKRYIQALLDYGFIEPYLDHPRARKMSRPKDDNELPWYRIRLEFYEFFKDDLTWFSNMDAKTKQRMLRNGIGEGRIRLTFGKG